MNLKRELATVRRQNTCLRKQLRRLERERSPATVRVVRWARRWAKDFPSQWDAMQLRLAVSALTREEAAR